MAVQRSIEQVLVTVGNFDFGVASKLTITILSRFGRRSVTSAIRAAVAVFPVTTVANAAMTVDIRHPTPTAAWTPRTATTTGGAGRGCLHLRHRGDPAGRGAARDRGRSRCQRGARRHLARRLRTGRRGDHRPAGALDRALAPTAHPTGHPGVSGLCHNSISATAPNFAVLAGGRLLCALTHGLMWSVIAPIARPPGARRPRRTCYRGGVRAARLWRWWSGNPLTAAISELWGWRVAVLMVAAAATAGPPRRARRPAPAAVRRRALPAGPVAMSPAAGRVRCRR